VSSGEVVDMTESVESFDEIVVKSRVEFTGFSVVVEGRLVVLVTVDSLVGVSVYKFCTLNRIADVAADVDVVTEGS
jgi:hypothetical protein